MRELNFTIDKQKLSKSGDFSNIIRGSKGYLKCRFNFEGTDWLNHKLIAVFESNGEEFARKLNIDKTCIVPDEVTDGSYFKVRVVGANLKQSSLSMITTNKLIISQGG